MIKYNLYFVFLQSGCKPIPRENAEALQPLLMTWEFAEFPENSIRNVEVCRHISFPWKL